MFAQLLSRNIENPQYPLTDGEAWRKYFGGATTQSGIRVTAHSALNVGAVWQAVDTLAGDIAKLPLNLYRKDNEDGREIAERHPAQYLVRHEPNDELTAFEFWRQLVTDLKLFNNAYAVVRFDAMGRPSELLPLLPDRTGPEVHDGERLYVSEIGGRLVTFDPAEIIHLRGLTPTTKTGKAPELLHHAREVIGLALAEVNFNAKFYRNGMRVSGILTLPEGLSKPARDRLEADFREGHEGGEFFKTAVLRDGAKFQSVSASARDSQSHEMREDQVRDLARFFKMPPSRLGLSDSVSYNSRSEDNQAYFDSTLFPDLCMVVGQCRKRLLTRNERRRGRLYFEHNTSSMLRMNQQQRYNAYAIAIDRDFLTINEARKMENLPPVPWGDDRRGGEVESMEPVVDDPPPRKPPTGQQPKDEDDDEEEDRRRRDLNS